MVGTLVFRSALKERLAKTRDELPKGLMREVLETYKPNLLTRRRRSEENISEDKKKIFTCKELVFSILVSVFKKLLYKEDLTWSRDVGFANISSRSNFQLNLHIKFLGWILPQKLSFEHFVLHFLLVCITFLRNSVRSDFSETYSSKVVSAPCLPQGTITVVPRFESRHARFAKQ